MWLESIAAVNRHLADEVNGELWYGHVDMRLGGRTATSYGALDAFFPAVLALSGDLERARRLQDSSFKMWTTFGIEPEQLNYRTMKSRPPATCSAPRSSSPPTTSNASPATRATCAWAPNLRGLRQTLQDRHGLRRAQERRDEGEAGQHGELPLRRDLQILLSPLRPAERHWTSTASFSTPKRTRYEDMEREVGQRQMAAGSLDAERGTFSSFNPLHAGLLPTAHLPPHLPAPARRVYLRCMKRHTHAAIDLAFIALGILSAAFGLEGFLLSSHFIDGGVTGVSMLLAKVPSAAGAPDARHQPAVHRARLPADRRARSRSERARDRGLSLCLAFVHFPDVTPDKLLTAVFGGFFIGAGIGLAIRGGAVLDGTEIAALLDQQAQQPAARRRRHPHPQRLHLPAAAFFLGVESALYSILTYFAASKTARLPAPRHRGIHGRSSSSPSRARRSGRRSSATSARGVTVYKGRRADRTPSRTSSSAS